MIHETTTLIYGAAVVCEDSGSFFKKLQQQKPYIIMTNLLKSVMRAVGAVGNIFLASMAVFCAISEGKDDPIYAAFTIGVIVAMWNALIFVCTHWDD